MKLLKPYVFILFILCSSKCIAQNYDIGIGPRFGLSNGISVKHFVDSTEAIETIVATRWGGIYLVGLYEKHYALFNNPNSTLYYGGGLHGGIWGVHGFPFPVIGIDGIIGIEYTFDRAPFSLAIDYRPAYNLIFVNSHWLDEVSLSIKFVF